MMVMIMRLMMSWLLRTHCSHRRSVPHLRVHVLGLDHANLQTGVLAFMRSTSTLGDERSDESTVHSLAIIDTQISKHDQREDDQRTLSPCGNRAKHDQENHASNGLNGVRPTQDLGNGPQQHIRPANHASKSTEFLCKSFNRKRWDWDLKRLGIS